MSPRSGGGPWRWLKYRVVSAVIHQPGLLRLAGALIRRWPLLEGKGGVVVRHSAAAQIFNRDASFSNTAHLPNLVAGEFAIGMESGPRHDAERAYLKDKLPTPADFASATLAESRRRIADLRTADPSTFDLVEDYMLWIAWAGMRGIFGSAAPAIESVRSVSGSEQTARAAMLAFFKELRYLGAHLLVGAVATSRVQARAHRSADALNGRVEASLAALRCAWSHRAGSDAEVQRNTTGLMWVGHPATTQAGALVVQELLGRRDVYGTLRQEAQRLNLEAWTDEGFRKLVRNHVLELLRFRPAFPILLRNVPRDTEYELDEGRRGAARAGKQVTLITAAAMFDPEAMAKPWVYRPDRPVAERCDAQGRYLIFGLGPRSCIAQEHVVEMLVSALVGLLTLPRLEWADPWFSRISYDGPIITRMRLKFGR